MKIRSSTLGFTLTELILVIVLLSILSLFAASRFIGKSSFSAFVLQEQVISVIRQVQVNRMQSNVDNPDSNFQLKISSSCIGSVAACALSGSAQDARSDVVDGSAQFSTQTLGDDVTLNFSLLGNPLNDSGDPLTTASGGVSIIIEDKDGQSRCAVNINSQGYVSKGSCL
jgi:MSHA pilin protein MshC